MDGGNAKVQVSYLRNDVLHSHAHRPMSANPKRF